MNLKNLLFTFAALVCGSLFAQETFPPTEIIQGTFIGKTIPLRDFPTVENNLNMDPKTLTIFPNRSRYNPQVNDDALPNGIDNNAQSTFGGIYSFPLEQNFIGASASESGFLPPDPTGAVGPNHYVHSVNSIVKIFDKTGTLLVGPTALGTFLGIGSNSGDPIVLYDQLADRYFVSEFGSLSNSLAIGISDTNDPTGAYNVYQFSLDAFPDYPHYSIWPDAYYLTANKGGANKVYAIERDVMLAGGANPQIVGFPLPGGVQNTNTVLSPEPANLTGTSFPANVPGYIVYLQDDGWAGVTFDHLKVWEIEVDWVTVGNSTISTALEIPTDPFNSVFAPFGSGDVGQPGTSNKIDMIGGVISFAANYRSFGTHNSWVITFNTDIDGNDTSGVRWVELRNDSSNPWTVFQEGTYAPADGHSRFMGSAAMDAAGNIGLGFNIASVTLPAGIRYTGRFDGDPLGQMTIAETTIVDGVGVQTTTNRFGDYSHLTMDPDNFTFWHTAEFFSSNNQWRTQVASFSLSGGFTADVGISDIVQPVSGILTNAETVEVTIRNFGSASQANIPLELRVDGNLVASETFTGTINANQTDTYTFAQTVDLSTAGQTYSIEVKTDLTGDEFTSNDTFTKEVTHEFANDLGVIEIVEPTSGEGLGNETVTINIENFGAAPQSNFDVSYTIDSGTAVTESVVGPIGPGAMLNYSFTTTADLSVEGTYEFEASTDLGTDSDTSNDSTTKTVINLSCASQGNDTNFPVGPDAGAVTNSVISYATDIAVNDVNVNLNLEHTWVGDLTITLIAPDNTQVVLADGVCGDCDDMIDVTFDDEAANPISSATDPITGSYQPEGNLSDFDGLSTIGDWTLRIVDNANQDGGQLLDWTLQLCGDPILGVDDTTISDSELIVTSLPENQFEISLLSDYDGLVYVGVYNLIGQQIGFKLVPKVNNMYRLNLNMSNTASGVYLLRVGGQSAQTYKSARIIVR